VSRLSRLVTHMSRFESQIPNLRICITSCDSISSFMELRTFARGGWTVDEFGHSSKASTIRQTGASPGSLSRSFKHPASAQSLG
jgi:hypothetical protein